MSGIKDEASLLMRIRGASVTHVKKFGMSEIELIEGHYCLPVYLTCEQAEKLDEKHFFVKRINGSDSAKKKKS